MKDALLNKDQKVLRAWVTIIVAALVTLITPYVLHYIFSAMR